MTELPKILYRYRPFHPDYLAREIVDRQIYFCQLDSFNDPYEGRLRMNLKFDDEMSAAFVKALATGPLSTERDRNLSIQVFGPERTFLMERMRYLASMMSPQEIDMTATLLASLPGLKPM